MPDVRVLPCTLALFGALGDLALRKLFPALYQLDRENLLHRDTRVLALARDEGAPAEHLATLEQRLRLAVPAKVGRRGLAAFPRTPRLPEHGLPRPAGLCRLARGGG